MSGKKEVLGVSTMTHKFQITIPKRVREEQGWKANDPVMFIKDGNKVYLTNTEL